MYKKYGKSWSIVWVSEIFCCEAPYARVCINMNILRVTQYVRICIRVEIAEGLYLCASAL